jgi:cytochrome c biogenesis protein CcdA
MRRSVLKAAFGVLTAMAVSASGCGSGSGSSSQTLSDYQRWIENLPAGKYAVAQGNVYLMQNTDCPTYVAIFDSCFGQNPASPYIIPQPAIGQSYVDP